MEITAIRVKCRYNTRKRCVKEEIKKDFWGRRKCVEFYKSGLCELREAIALDADEIIKQMERDGYVFEE